MTDLLEQQLAATANPLDDSDWLAVRRRVRRPRRRIGLAAVAAVIALAAAVPAFGLSGKFVDLIQGTPAPQAIKTYFAASDALRQKLLAEAPAATGAMSERYTPVVEDARGVFAIDSPDGPIFLWAAPTEQGGQCWLIQTGEDTGTKRPYGMGACEGANPGGGMSTDVGWTAERPNVQIVHARVRDDSIVSVEVQLEHGDPVSLPVASGHALGTLPMNVRVAAFVGLNAAGEEVARSKQ
jgi:hypothetical protein